MNKNVLLGILCALTSLFAAHAQPIADLALRASQVSTKPDQLYRAADAGNLAMVKKLIKEGVHANTRFAGHDSKTILHVAAEKNHYDMVVYLVRECRADVSLRDDADQTPLDIARVKGNKQIIEFLESL